MATCDDKGKGATTSFAALCTEALKACASDNKSILHRATRLHTQTLRGRAPEPMAAELCS
jgi:hypothetical protein